MQDVKSGMGQFFKKYPGYISHSGPLDAVRYQEVSIDSRRIKAGELFIALRGENFDGHSFLQQALEKNAAGVVVDAQWTRQSSGQIPRENAAVIVVKDTLNFLQELSAWHRNQFSIPVLGVTGSNGKTTVRNMIVEILSKKYRVASNEGNQNNHIGVPLTLLKIEAGHQMAVIELGSNHPGEIDFLTRLIQPTMGLITNIGKGHIGYFGDLDSIYREKTALFQRLSTDSTIFKNMEDPYLKNYRRSGLKTITVGYSDKYDVWGTEDSVDQLGCVKFTLNGTTSIQLKIPGSHQFGNALLAAAVGLESGVASRGIKEVLENFTAVKQRMEIFERRGILIVNDAYNANPDSTRAAIDYLVSLPGRKGKKILALGDMLELGDFAEKEHEAIGRYIAGKPVDFVFLYGPLSPFVEKGLKKNDSGAIRFFRYETHEEIARHLDKILAPGDVLLLKGSRGMIMETILQKLTILEGTW